MGLCERLGLLFGSGDKDNDLKSVQTDTPHTRFFSDTFVLVFTPHCGSRCLWRAFIPSSHDDT